MNLYVDIGNTRIKWARGDDEVLQPQQALVREATMDWPQHLPLADARRVIVASVAQPEPVTTLQTRAADYDVPVHVAQTAARVGDVVNAYPQPQAHGVDRWMTCLAAHAREPRSVLIADAGTATTLDWVDARGQHGGGLIAPGIGAMRSTLQGNTQLCPGEVPVQNRWLATETKGAIALGTLRSTVALLDNAAAELAPKRLLLTGGDASRLAPYLARDWDIVPQLVLEGLVYYARHAMQMPNSQYSTGKERT